MAYVCPRCGDKVHRGYSKGAQMAGGLVGAAFYAAFGSFECAKCGKIANSEFSPDVRSRMARGTVLLVAGGIVLLVVIVILLTALN